MPVVLVSVLALLSATLPGGTFTDDDGSVHEGGIEAIAAASITVGCNPPFNDEFCPDRDITRAEMATMISRALGLGATSNDYFIDDNGHVLEGGINRIAEAGITTGCDPDARKFCPNRTLTRAEAATFIARALKLPPSNIDHFVDDDGHVLEGGINRIADAGITQGCNPPANDRFCPNRELTRGQMATMLTRALLHLSPIKPPPRPSLSWELVVSGLNSPIQVLAPPGEDRLLIAQQGGTVLAYANDSASVFLDIEGDVLSGGERGLLSIALHPEYPADRRLFAWYTGNGGDTHLVEFDIAPDLASASSPRTVLTVQQPFSNHNGGFLSFGDDGYLYLSIGDGGSANDPGNRARNLNTLLGKMIRIDVDGTHPYGIPTDNPYVGQSGRDEIWASGLRNPWRWSFDDGYMFIGDVGQAAREEINLVEVDPRGYDFGWSRFEGTLCNPNDQDPSCSTSGLTFPVVEYGRALGRSVTGGVVHRGPTVRSMDQFYVYADVFSGRVWGFRHVEGRIVTHRELTGQLGLAGIVHFGIDNDGELLAVSLFDNSLYRLTGG
jgi:glucose/arabinose dehydrogenase